VLGSERPGLSWGHQKNIVMTVTYSIGVTALSAADKIAIQLLERGIPVKVEEKNPVQLLLHIEVPDDATFNDVLALGALVGSIETGALVQR